jgi:hypothetical protein
MAAVDAIEGFSNKVVLGDTSPLAPALAAHDGRLFIAWRGDGNDNLNVMFSSDNGVSFGGKFVSGETSTASPALVSHNGLLFVAWKGDGNDNLNVAQVDLFADSAGGFGIDGFSNKLILGDTSPLAPALASHDGRLFIAWKGDGNDNLNVMFSLDNGASFGGKFVSSETSSDAPALASNGSGLFIAWKGSGNDNLNVAEVSLFADSSGGFGIDGFSNKVILGDTSPTASALGSAFGDLFLAWKGDGNDNLNVMFSSDNGASFGGKLISDETSPDSPALATLNDGLFISWKGDGNDNLNVAEVDLVGSVATP